MGLFVWALVGCISLSSEDTSVSSDSAVPQEEVFSLLSRPAPSGMMGWQAHRKHFGRNLDWRFRFYIPAEEVETLQLIHDMALRPYGSQPLDFLMELYMRSSSFNPVWWKNCPTSSPFVSYSAVLRGDDQFIVRLDYRPDGWVAVWGYYYD